MPDKETRISDVRAAAGQPGDAHRKAVIGQVPGWLAGQAKAYGLDIDGFRLSFETSAARHIINRHFNNKIELSRGQIALTDADIDRIPEILGRPERLVFGAKNPRRQPLIGFIKQLPDGIVLLLGETRTGRKELAIISMRKYPATALSDDIAATLEPNGRTDGGDGIHIVDVIKNVTTIIIFQGETPATIDANTTAGPLDPNGQTDGEAPAGALSDRIAGTLESNGGTDAGIAKPPPPLTHTLRRRVLHYLPPVLGVLVLSAIIFGLHRALKHVSLDDVLAALQATPGAEIAHALLLLGVSFCIMLIYDIPGILFAKKLFDFPRLGMRRIGLASFSAYSLSHVLGAPALSAAAIRLRLYAQWGVPAAGIARIITLSGTMFALGTCALLGGVLLFHPLEVPLLGHDVTPLALRALGAALWVVIGLYVRAARKTAPLQIFGKTIPRPGWGLAITQVLLSCADTGIACAILYVVLPTVPGLTYPHVLAIYLAAFAGGLFSGLPGGVGVFDSVLLLGLAGTMDPARAIGAILLFRVLYYLGPAALGGLCFAGHEIWITARRGKPEV